jgi:hypothetical protein
MRSRVFVTTLPLSKYKNFFDDKETCALINILKFYGVYILHSDVVEYSSFLEHDWVDIHVKKR